MTDEEEKTSIHRPHKPLPSDNERTVVAGAPRQVARLRATLEDGMQTFLPLSSTAVALTIGRDPSCGWYLQDLSVSRKHATVRWSGIALSIEDHGSSGGTFVGTRQVGATPCLVRPGDSVRVGDAVLVLELTPQSAAEVEQTRMVAKPSPMSQAVTPAPSRNRPSAHDAEDTVRPLGDHDATAHGVELPAVVVAREVTEEEIRLPAAAEPEVEHEAVTRFNVQAHAPAPKAAAQPHPVAQPHAQAKQPHPVAQPHAQAKQPHPVAQPHAVAQPKPAQPHPVALPKAAAPRPPATPKPAPLEADAQTTEAEIPLPEAQPWNQPAAARKAEPARHNQAKTQGEIQLPPVRQMSEQPRTEAEIQLPPAQARTETHPLPENQQPTEAQILLPEAKARAPLPATEAEIRLPEVAAARPAARASVTLPPRDAAHDPPVYVPERDVLAPSEDTRSWALETALAKPKEGLFGARRQVVKSGMPVKGPDGKVKPAGQTTAQTAGASAAATKRRRILLLGAPALLAIITTASAWSQGSPAPAAPPKPAARAAAAAPQQRTAAKAEEEFNNSVVAQPVGGDPQAIAAAQEELLAAAIRAYSDGNRAEAMSIFKRMGPSDPTARAMVHIITLQAGEGQ